MQECGDAGLRDGGTTGMRGCEDAGLQVDAFLPRPAREGSGTSWIPDASPMNGLDIQAGSWTLMLHGQANLQWLAESGSQHYGSHGAGSINWFMADAEAAHREHADHLAIDAERGGVDTAPVRLPRPPRHRRGVQRRLDPRPPASARRLDGTERCVRPADYGQHAPPDLRRSVRRAGSGPACVPAPSLERRQP